MSLQRRCPKYARRYKTTTDCELGASKIADSSHSVVDSKQKTSSVGFHPMRTFQEESDFAPTSNLVECNKAVRKQKRRPASLRKPGDFHPSPISSLKPDRVCKYATVFTGPLMDGDSQHPILLFVINEL